MQHQFARAGLTDDSNAVWMKSRDGKPFALESNSWECSILKSIASELHF